MSSAETVIIEQKPEVNWDNLQEVVIVPGSGVLSTPSYSMSAALECYMIGYDTTIFQGSCTPQGAIRAFASALHVAKEMYEHPDKQFLIVLSGTRTNPNSDLSEADAMEEVVNYYCGDAIKAGRLVVRKDETAYDTSTNLTGTIEQLEDGLDTLRGNQTPIWAITSGAIERTDLSERLSGMKQIGTHTFRVQEYFGHLKDKGLELNFRGTVSAQQVIYDLYNQISLIPDRDLISESSNSVTSLKARTMELFMAAPYLYLGKDLGGFVNRLLVLLTGRYTGERLNSTSAKYQKAKSSGR